MNFKIVIPARANSKRLPGKNMKILGKKPLIEYSIDYALNYFNGEDIWVNSDDLQILQFADKKAVKILPRPINLATDLTATVDVLKFNVNYFIVNDIACDAIILLQPTNPFREPDLLEKALEVFEKSARNSLATFSILEKKIGNIENEVFTPRNYLPGQRSQDLEKSYFENGQLYITKCHSILKGKIITEDVYPFVCNNLEATVDIDNYNDFKLAELLLKFKDERK